ncbi:uncharacterized protein LOC127079810 [Lathyrus oleraceus]|uniref:uncharacterized protein LOC127079810 n=1 Tax=Pisum sativum TaxID=3888 RepID=UPI0021D2013B|nr:uncharacterized protein LOC127079810 [Pisum sativum]
MQNLNDPNPELPDYIKPLYPIIKKKLIHEEEARMFAKFKEMLTTLQAILKGTKQKVVKEQVNMTERDEIAVPQTFPPKLKDPGKFTISCNIGGVKIPHALCDLGYSINVMPSNKVKEFNLGEIILSNMTLTLADSFVTHSLDILQDLLVHVDVLVFPMNLVVLDTKGDSGGSVILRCPFLKNGKALINLETGELVLKFNKEKVAQMTSQRERLTRGSSSRVAPTPNAPTFPNLKFLFEAHAEKYLKLVDYHIVRERAFLMEDLQGLGEVVKVLQQRC